MADIDYYRNLDDYDDIKDFIEMDPPGFKLEIPLPPFEPGSELLNTILNKQLE